jgi:hypothetical protein
VVVTIDGTTIEVVDAMEDAVVEGAGTGTVATGIAVAVVDA